MGWNEGMRSNGRVGRPSYPTAGWTKKEGKAGWTKRVRSKGRVDQRGEKYKQGRESG